MVVLVVLIGQAIWNPVAASRVLWPVLENVVLREPFLGITAGGEIEPGLLTSNLAGARVLEGRESAR